MADKEQGKEGKGEKKAALARKTLIFSLMVTGVIFLPSSIVLGICMLPALVAAIVDGQAQKTAWLTVGAMNLAGSIPALFALWETGHTVDAAMQTISRPNVLLTAYGGAAIGWMIYNGVTPLVGSIVVARNESRIKDIEKRQKELIRKWGNDVTSS